MVSHDSEGVLLEVKVPTTGISAASRMNRRESDKVAEAILGEGAFVVKGELPGVITAPFSAYVRTKHYEMGTGSDPEDALNRAKEFLAIYEELKRIREEREELARLEKERKEAEKLTKLRDEVASELDPYALERTYAGSSQIVKNAIDIIIEEREHRS